MFAPAELVVYEIRLFSWSDRAKEILTNKIFARNEYRW